MKKDLLSTTKLIGFIAFALLFSSCSKQNSLVVAQVNNADKTAIPIPTKSENSNQSQNVNASKNINMPKPEILSRESWKAKTPFGKGIEHTIKFITIHHTASAQKPNTTIEKKLQNLQNFSQSKAKLANGKTKPAWFDVPYHYYIATNGKIAEAREIKFAGDTNTDYDPTGHALIVLEGNFETEKPTAEQIESMKILTAWLADKYKVSNSDIKAHNDYTSTACPGKNLKSFLPKLLESLIIQTISPTKS